MSAARLADAVPVGLDKFRTVKPAPPPVPASPERLAEFDAMRAGILDGVAASIERTRDDFLAIRGIDEVLGGSHAEIHALYRRAWAKFAVILASGPGSRWLDHRYEPTPLGDGVIVLPDGTRCLP